MVAVPAQDPLGRLERVWLGRPGVLGWLTTVDHKRIGLLYFWTTLVFFGAGGVEALLIRTQLAQPNGTVVGPETYDQLLTMHGVTMIFFFIIPMTTGAFGNYLLPLMIGARDMAFPRLNALSYWLFLGSGCLLYSSFLVHQAPDAGWFDYVPLALKEYDGGLNIDFYCLGLILNGIASTVAATNLIVTTLRLRAPGMSLNRMPLFCFAMLAASFSLVFALPPLTLDLVFLELQRTLGFHFFDVAHGGDSLLWQDLFWIFGHPEVYIIVLPAFGIATSIIPTFARHRMVAFPLVAMAELLVVFIGFGVWAHHMFTTGLPTEALIFFAAASMMVVIPSTIQIFAWVMTVNIGTPVFRAPLLFIGGFIAFFVIGGLSGIMFAAIPFDQASTDTYFVVAHFHFIIFGAAVFPLFGGMYYWFPKVTGRMYNEPWAKASFWVTAAGTALTFFPMHIVGLLGMTRRVYTYDAGLGWGIYNLLETIGGFTIAVGLLIIFANLIYSGLRGERAGPDPFHGGTLEWTIPSPPPSYNFAVIPTVRSPYPNWDLDTREADRERLRRGEPLLDAGHETTLSTPADGHAVEVVDMPAESPWPIVLALTTTLAFACLLTSHSLIACACFAAGGLVLLAWHAREPGGADEPAVGGPRTARPLGWWGMAVLVASEATLFAAIFGSYFYLRFRGVHWPPVGEPEPDWLGPLVATTFLVSTSILVQLAWRAGRAGRRVRAWWLLAPALAVQVGYLVYQLISLANELDKLRPTSGAYGSLTYVLLGADDLHVFVGALLVGWLLARLGRGLTRYRLVGLQATTLYWHAVNLISVLVLLTELSPRL